MSCGTLVDNLPLPCVIWWHYRKPFPFECHILFEWPPIHTRTDTHQPHTYPVSKCPKQWRTFLEKSHKLIHTTHTHTHLHTHTRTEVQIKIITGQSRHDLSDKWNNTSNYRQFFVSFEPSNRQQILRIKNDHKSRWQYNVKQFFDLLIFFDAKMRAKLLIIIDLLIRIVSIPKIFKWNSIKLPFLFKNVLI